VPVLELTKWLIRRLVPLASVAERPPAPARSGP
jgi:hypothetical protein